MKKIYAFILVISFSMSNIARADEGMWLPFLLGRNYSDMQKHGLRLTQEQIYSINTGSLKDAIVSFGGFCTGEIISKNGLILTNHHCGYDAIASNSTKEKNLLDDGFWAKNHEEEISIPGLFANFMVRIEDVTATVSQSLNDSQTPEERTAAIQKAFKILADDAKRGTHYEAFVRDFFNGNEFYLFVTEKFTDIRLVGTPPQSAGKYGGDTDNWMWPRHTADFSMFRVYAGADNKPATFNAANKPFTPRHSLPVSLKGIQKDDYAMIMGFPGRTNRYLTSVGVEQAITIDQPKRVEVRKMKLDMMKKYMDKDVTVRLNYSSNYAQVANYWKYFIGQSQQLKNNKVADKKRAIENDFTNFAGKNPAYATVLPDINAAFGAIQNYILMRVYMQEFVAGTDMNILGITYVNYLRQLAKNDAATAGNIKTAITGSSEEFYAKGNMNIELETLEAGLALYLRDIPANQKNEYLLKLTAGGPKALAKLMASIRKKSVIMTKEKFDASLTSKSPLSLAKDPFFLLMENLYANYEKVVTAPELVEADKKLAKGNRLFVKGLREMNTNKNYYPNANSTFRLTYGNVLPYSPKDGISYDYVTTIEGVLEKEDQSNPEFALDAKTKKLALAKDFGRYADKKSGKLIVNFLTNNDITGGNSGSPVINADGHLIGAAFDGNWEAMSGDIYFEPELQRTIVCDIRYILWLIDKVGGASHIVNEMEIVE